MGVNEKQNRLPEETGRPASPDAERDPACERHYTVREIATLWKLSEDSVRRLFKDEPGVLSISPRQRSGKRAYATLRIPESVLERVHRKLSIVRILTR
jgi:hypothetical protein